MSAIRSTGWGGIFAIASILGALHAPRAEDTAWVSLLNGKNLDGWTPYFSSPKLRNRLTNPDSTFKVTPEGWLHVDVHLPYDSVRVGHLFYTRRKLSYYMVRGVYRYTTKVLGPGWTGADNIQNNGFMIHCAAPAEQTQDFPPSVEVQLVGPANTFFNRDLVSQGWKYGTSMNLCANGITASLNGRDVGSNCHHASYPDAWKNTEIPWEDKEGWSDAAVRVLADSLFQHFIHGVKVHEYSRIRRGGQPLKEGYLAVQAEGSSTQFKSLEVLDLVGCMDPTKPGYRTYFVKNDPGKCEVAGVGRASRPDDAPVLKREGRSFSVAGSQDVILAVRRPDGSRVELAPGARAFTPSRAGIYLVSIRTAGGIAVRKAARY
jgi:hypothetical protein